LFFEELDCDEVAKLIAKNLPEKYLSVKEKFIESGIDGRLLLDCKDEEFFKEILQELGITSAILKKKLKYRIAKLIQQVIQCAFCQTKVQPKDFKCLALRMNNGSSVKSFCHSHFLESFQNVVRTKTL
jgi:hypothetical protein